MKKFFMIAAMAAVTVSFASCTKDDNKGGKDDEVTVKREYRVKSMADNWGGGYNFEYNADGTVKAVTNEWDNRQFTYEGSKLTITNGDAVEYTLTLNKDGFATEVKNAEHTWTITYDSKGYMIEGKKDGVKCTSQSIEDGNVLYWTRYDSEHDFWRMKDATYYDNKINSGCVQTHYAEDLGFSRWMWEARLFGNTSVNVLESCRWHNYGDEMAAKTAVYTYEYDANGVITKECKYYGVWNETDTTGLDEDTITTFTWEKIK